jgi:hypothetical protein
LHRIDMVKEFEIVLADGTLFKQDLRVKNPSPIV